MMKRVISMLLAALMLLSLVGCGTPGSKEETEKIETLLAEGDFEKICAEVDTVEAFMELLVVSDIKEGHEGTIETAFTEKRLPAEKILEMACLVLEEDYEEVGTVTAHWDHYTFFYVKQAEGYFLYDLLRHSYGVEPGPYESKDDMIEYAAMKRGDIANRGGSVQTWQTQLAPNGKKLTQNTTLGVPTFSYAGTTIPVGLGLPKLTDEEIDTLLAENDPRKVKETISTLADFVNYCYRGEFIFGDGLVFLIDKNGWVVQTTSSGYQTLQMRMGQCASMSSCLRYVLDDDYDETGYVVIDQHLMVYILCDGLYYLVNPVEYVFTAYNNYSWGRAWLDYIAHDGTGTYCSANFQDIADSIYGRFIGTEITYVYTITGPGDFVRRRGLCEVPEETMATCWYGAEPVNYFSFPEYDWMSQENVVDRDAIVMFPPPEGQWVPFGGIHEDSYTAEQYPNSYLK